MPNEQGKRAGYIISAIITIVFLLVMNKIPDWNFSFVLPTYRDALWAINLSLGVQIALYVILTFYHPPLFHNAAQVAFSAVTIIAIGVILTVFPVDFTRSPGPWLNTMFRVACIVGIAGSAVSIVVHTVRAAKELTRR